MNRTIIMKIKNLMLPKKKKSKSTFMLEVTTKVDLNLIFSTPNCSKLLETRQTNISRSHRF